MNGLHGLIKIRLLGQLFNCDCRHYESCEHRRFGIYGNAKFVRTLAVLWPAALEDTYILLSRQGAGVVAVDHIDAGPGVSGKGQHVETVAV